MHARSPAPGTSAPTTPRRPPRAHLVWTRRSAAVLVAVCLGQFLLQLDLTVVNVALPAIGGDTGATVQDLQWVVDAYNLAVAGLLLAAGAVADRVGYKRVYLVGLAVFGLGSLLCALAPGAGALIAARVVQGIGAAIELPATLAILTRTFADPRVRAVAVGIWTGAAGSALVVGPTLGGLLVELVGWRAVFAVNVPVVAAAGVLTALAVANSPAGRRTQGRLPERFDLVGQLAGAAALVLLAGGAIDGGRRGFDHPLPMGLLAAGGLAGLLLHLHRRRTTRGHLDQGSRRMVAVANVAAVVMGFVTIGLLFLLSLFFQRAQGISALGAGLRFLPLTVAFVVTGPLVGRAVGRIGHRLPMAGGAALMAVGALLLLPVQTGSGYGLVAGPLLLAGIGYGLLSTPMAAAVLAAVPAERAGAASAGNLDARLVGGVFGIAVLGAFLHAGPGVATAQSLTAGVHTALLVAAAVAATGALVLAGGTGRRA